MIQVTENAVRQLKDMLEDSSRGLRLLVQKGGCAGFQYGMKLDDPNANDTVVQTEGGRLFVDPDSLPYLKDSLVDYSDSLTDAGFKITNPNAARSCGCGTSFEPGVKGKEPEYDPSMDGSVCGEDDSNDNSAS